MTSCSISLVFFVLWFLGVLGTIWRRAFFCAVFYVHIFREVMVTEHNEPLDLIAGTWQTFSGVPGSVAELFTCVCLRCSPVLLIGRDVANGIKQAFSTHLHSFFWYGDAHGFVEDAVGRVSNPIRQMRPSLCFFVFAHSTKSHEWRVAITSQHCNDQQ